MRTITLTEDEYAALLAMMGYATGCALRDGDMRRFYASLRLANAVSKDNPDWTAYKVPEGV